jgi:hypothetical protein
MLWVPSRLVRSRSRLPGFILHCQLALADRPPSGPEARGEVAAGIALSTAKTASMGAHTSYCGSKAASDSAPALVQSFNLT